jgi:hypothetical protein
MSAPKHDYEVELHLKNSRDPIKQTVTADNAIDALKQVGSAVQHAVERAVIDKLPLKILTKKERDLFRAGYLGGLKDAAEDWDRYSDKAREDFFEQWLGENGYDPKEVAP